MSTKIIHREPVFTKRREQLIDMCVSLKRHGKDFLYILPSCDAMRSVRSQIYSRGGGVEGSEVITLDELERNIAYGFRADHKILDPMVDKIILNNLCVDLKEELLYFKEIAEKEGFKDDIYIFIRQCKRQGVSPTDLEAMWERITDRIFRDKLRDIYSIYLAYEKELQKRDVHSPDDIATIALHNTAQASYLDNIDTIVVDGFINIDPIDIDLLQEIVDRGDIHIYVNVPYINPLMNQFVDRELIEPLIGMGFDVEDGEVCLGTYKSNIDKLVRILYMGEQIDIDTDNLSLKRYPCIRSEVWGVGQDIKKKLEEGESPHNIAVYIGDMEEQSKYILSIFKEFGIPIDIGYNIPISSSTLARELIEDIEKSDMQHMYLAQWLGLVEDYLYHRQEELSRESDEMNDYNILNTQVYKVLEGQLRILRSSLGNGHMLDSIMTKADFLNYLIRWTLATKVQIEHRDRPGVKILGIDRAGGQYYDHVYILGMNDGIIPSLPSDIDMLSRQEREMLMDMDINYKNRDWELEREKIRLCLVLATAKKSVALSYRETGRGDEPLIPSPLTEEIKLVSGLKEEIIPMKDRFEAGGRNNVSSSAEEYIYRHRQRGKYFNNYEGIVEPALLSLDDNFYLGATDIDKFYFCPYSFFMDKFMGGRLFEQSPIEYDNMDAGSFYHSMLRNYYMDLEQFESLDEDRLENIYNGVIEAEIRELEFSLEEQEHIKGEFFGPLYDIVAVFISKDLKRLKKYETDTGCILRPIMVEESLRDSSIFGVDMRSRVDRVDMEYEYIDGNLVPTGKFAIYDYKKSRSRGLDHILKNNVCQLGIYYFLVLKRLEELGYKNLDCMALLYYGIEENGEGDGKAIRYDGLYRAEYKKELGLGRKHYAMDGEVFDAFLGYIKDLTLYAIEQIRDGKFPYAPNCPVHTQQFVIYSCEYKDVCRYSSDKIMSILREGGTIQYGEPFKGV